MAPRAGIEPTTHCLEGNFLSCHFLRFEAVFLCFLPFFLDFSLFFAIFFHGFLRIELPNSYQVFGEHNG